MRVPVISVAKGLHVACTVLVWLATVAVVRAEPALSLQTELNGLPLGQTVALLEDPGGKLTIDDVQGERAGNAFRMGTAAEPNFGFSKSAYWVRLRVHNPTETSVRWLLELANPHLDEITLYEPLADGRFIARVTGDHTPFATRGWVYRTFLFPLSEQPGSTRTYYLRARTTGSMNLAMHAWDYPHFLEHQPRDLGALFLFYGVLAVMALYNLTMWLLIRQREHLHYVSFITAIAVLQLTLSGHTFQFLVPDHPWLHEQMLPLSMAWALSSACYVGNAYVRNTDVMPGLSRVIERVGLALFIVGPLSGLLPYSTRLVLMISLFIALVGLALLPCVVLLRMRIARARIYIVAWASVIAGFLITGLHVTGVLPGNLFTEWSCQIGTTIQLVLLSSSLADRITAMREDLGSLNGELSRKVELLESALLSAENATARAEQATRVKDEFMATMSHELRTPLNAIINVPQGLLRDFPRADGVSCARCGSTFELERGDKITRETPCPDCAQPGALKPKPLIRYDGKPEHTARYLAMIERSGKHLLQMVNGVLDFSKMELGRLELVLESFDLSELTRELVDELGLYAERAGVKLELNVPKSEPIVADPVRVKQILINLLSNAVKFSDGSGTVAVAIESKSDCVEIAVRDRGIGIAKEHFERIFGSFEQVHKGNTRKYGGTGLGLSISRSLARMHGGELWVESQLGQGSTFYFRIPRGLVGGRTRNASSSRNVKSVATGETPRHGEEMAS